MGVVPDILLFGEEPDPKKISPFGNKSFAGLVCINEGPGHHHLAPNYEAVQSGVSCAASFFLCPVVFAGDRSLSGKPPHGTSERNG